MSKSALIIGSSISGLQAALDIADAGVEVHIVEKSPFIRHVGQEAPPDHVMNSRTLDVLKHPRIHVWTNTNITKIKPRKSGLQVDWIQSPRYVNISRCTGCEDCIESCPITVIYDKKQNHQTRKAIYLDGQPGCVAIDKPGKAPCADACPGGIHVQGYVALIAQGRFEEAHKLIKDAIPFPSVCGRVCNHYCEQECNRGMMDQPVNIMALKRFVTDWVYKNRNDPSPNRKKDLESKLIAKEQKVAIIGAGPAGLTAARELVRKGYAVTVFEALPAPGGMMRVGIPPHRLSAELLDWEIQQILDEGVELRLNSWIDDIPGLLEHSYDAVLIATGAHKAKKLPIRNSNHPDNWFSLDVLRRACLGETVPINGKKATILGGGNVALDTVRTVLRMGASEVRMVCLEPRGEMPGFDWEIAVAEEEGVIILPGRTFKAIVLENDKIVGVSCAEVDFHGFSKGRPDFDEIPDTDQIIPADVVIWAIGQEPNFSFLPHDGSIDTQFPLGIRSDENMMTTLPGVFVAGDVHRGMTFFVIDAIGEGKMAARNIERYLQGEPSLQPEPRLPTVVLDKNQVKRRMVDGTTSSKARTLISSIPLEKRSLNFNEVDLTISEEQALTEANRCLSCGVCSECLACVDACSAGAINHDQIARNEKHYFGAIIATDTVDEIIDSPLIESPGFYQIAEDDALIGSAAAAVALKDLLIHRRPLPTSSSSTVQSSPGRIGVFICQCWDAIPEIIDVQNVLNYVSELADVFHVQLLPTSCSPEAAQIIGEKINSYSLDRIVLAACICCNIDQICFSCTYQRVRGKDNLGVFKPINPNWTSLRFPVNNARFEFVNIREQCAWVHGEDPLSATSKAKRMISAAVNRAQAASSILAGAREIDKSAILMGNGQAAGACKLALNWLGIHVNHITETPLKIDRAGGLFTVNTTESLLKASVLILTPANATESRDLLVAFGRVRRRPKTRKIWGGLETRRPGIFTIQPDLNPTIAGTATAARAVAWISRTESRPPIAAYVDQDRCRACKICIDTCEYGAPELVEIHGRYASWIDPAICTSCGTCAAHCPSGAITAGCSTDQQVEAMLDAIFC